MGIFVYIAIALFLFSAFLLFSKFRALGVEAKNAPAQERKDRLVSRLALGWKLSLVAGFACIALWKSVFYAEPGYYYAVQWFSGKQVAHTAAGFHFRGWGQVIEMKQNLTIKFSNKEDADYSGFSEPFGVRFNDAVQAQISASFRVRLPANPKQFLALALEYRSQDNLVNASLIPATKEVLRNSARMISAQEYIIGKGGMFENAVMDQIQNGIYELSIQTSRNGGERVQTDSMRSIGEREMVINQVSIKNDKDGRPIRKKHAFVEYGIEVTQAVIDDVEPEENFKRLLAMQRDAAGKSNVARQEAQRAEFEKQKVIAEGETEKAKIRVSQEQDQIKILVAAETRMKEAKTEVEKQKFVVQSEQLAAQATKIKADAQAYEKERMMKADNALEKRLGALVEINKAYAEAITGTQVVPHTLIVGEGGKSGGASAANNFLNILMANAANQVNAAMKEK